MVPQPVRVRLQKLPLLWLHRLFQYLLGLVVEMFLTCRLPLTTHSAMPSPEVLLRPRLLQQCPGGLSFLLALSVTTLTRLLIPLDRVGTLCFLTI